MHTWRWHEVKHWRLPRPQPLFILRNLLIASKHPHNSSSSCCRATHYLKHLDASFSESRPHYQLWKCHGCFLRLRLRFISFPASSVALCFHISREWVWGLDHDRSTTQIHLHCHTYEFAHFAWCIVSGGKWCVEPCKLWDDCIPNIYGLWRYVNCSYGILKMKCIPDYIKFLLEGKWWWLKVGILLSLYCCW